MAGGPMYGRASHTLYATFTNIKAGVSEADFRSWYADVHRPDSFERGLFQAASRQRAASPSAAACLTLWEADYPDTQSALAKIRPVAGQLREEGRILPVLDIVFQQFLQRVAFDLPMSGGEVHTLTTLQNDWSRPAHEQDFAAWWSEAVLSLQAPLELHHACHAYAAFDLEDPSAGKFLVLLESARAPAELEAQWRGKGNASLTDFGPPTPIYPEPGAPELPGGKSDASPEARRALHVVHWRHESDARSEPGNASSA